MGSTLTGLHVADSSSRFRIAPFQGADTVSSTVSATTLALGETRITADSGSAVLWAVQRELAIGT